MIYKGISQQTNPIWGFKLHTCGHTFTKFGRIIDRPNGFPYWVLFYVAKGSEKFSLNGEQIANEGSFIIYKPDERQKHICVSKPISEFYYIWFTADHAFDIFSFKTSTIYKTEYSTDVVNMFEKIIKETQLNNSNSDKICVFQFLELLSVLEQKIETTPKIDYLYDYKISNVVQLMNLEYQNPRSLEKYAALCNLSKYHFSRIFKEVTGFSPIEYRNMVRFNHAKSLLENTSLTIREISSMLGFAKASFFSDAFKKSIGISPKHYRENFKNNNNA